VKGKRETAERNRAVLSLSLSLSWQRAGASHVFRRDVPSACLLPCELGLLLLLLRLLLL